MSKKGFFFYELLIALILILTIMLFLVIPIQYLELRTNNHKYILEMKKSLFANVILYENGEELIETNEYRVFIEGQELCISFTDLLNKEQLICEKIWI